MKTKFAIYLLTILPLFESCDALLDETKYTYSISSETFYNTAEEANAAVLAPIDIINSPLKIQHIG